VSRDDVFARGPRRHLDELASSLDDCWQLGDAREIRLTRIRRSLPGRARLSRVRHAIVAYKDFSRGEHRSDHLPGPVAETTRPDGLMFPLRIGSEYATMPGAGTLDPKAGLASTRRPYWAPDVPPLPGLYAVGNIQCGA